jgi:hypothetical protein
MKKLLQYIIGIVFVPFIIQSGACDTIIVDDIDGDYPTIQEGLNAAQPGDSVLVKAGTYYERVTFPRSGRPDQYITLSNYNNDEVIINGKGLGTTYYSGVVRINGNNYIIVRGLTVKNGMCQISVTSGNYVEIRDNTTIGETTGIKWPDRGGASKTQRRGPGILIQGTSANVIIDGNDISYAAALHYESLRVMGNTTNFYVTNNIVHDNYYIGIDIVGRTSDGTPSNGLIDGNIVYNNYNPDGRGYSSGFYVDCAEYLTFSNNVVYDHSFGAGFLLRCEESGNSSNNIVLRNNLAHNNHYNYVIGHSYTRATVDYVKMYNNTSYEASSHYALYVRSGNNHVFKNNIFYQSNGKVFKKDSFAGSNLFFSHNLWYGGEGPGTDSLTADPRFVDSTQRNFNLSSDSPAIDKGIDVGLPPFNGSAPDMGAYEYTEEQKIILAPSNFRIKN